MVLDFKSPCLFGGIEGVYMFWLATLGMLRTDLSVVSFIYKLLSYPK